jgi:predicted GNAT superfamily acetyltransferase
MPAAPPQADPLVRPLASPADYDACVALQRATWGSDFRELVPPAVLLVAQKMGGVAAGVFAGERLLGFVFGFTGVRDGEVAHWSHMLAVDESVRDQGIGRRLKLYQRDRVRALGIRRMYWTFDPLVARNAHFNLNRLGARIAEYVRAMYGDNPMSRTDSVIGSDRFVVVWEVTDRPVDGSTDRRIEGSRGDDLPIIATDRDPLPEAAAVRVVIPGDIQSLKQSHPEAARAWRASTRRAFEHYLTHGYVVTAVTSWGDANSAYRLERAG